MKRDQAPPNAATGVLFPGSDAGASLKREGAAVEQLPVGALPRQ